MLKVFLPIGLITACFLIFSTTPSYAWLIYHKPAFKGKVIDAETKEPIEGAVVVVTYSKTTHLPPEAYSSIIEVRETLTDKNGEFYIPSYTTFIQPLSSEEWARFIIFKPGYGSFPNYHVSPPKIGVDPEKFFTGELGKEGEIEWEGIGTKTKLTFGIVELPKLKTREERLNKGLPSIPGPGISASKMKNLIKLSNEERISLGLEPETWP